MAQRYIPIATPTFDNRMAGLRRLDWAESRSGRRLSAYFDDSGPFGELRVDFVDTEVVRILDEVTISTDGTPTEGVIAGHLAYIVQESEFLRSYDVLSLTIPDLVHYQFITGNTSLDVASRVPPTFSFLAPTTNG